MRFTNAIAMAAAVIVSGCASDWRGAEREAQLKEARDSGELDNRVAESYNPQLRVLRHRHAAKPAAE